MIIFPPSLSRYGRISGYASLTVRVMLETVLPA